MAKSEGPTLKPDESGRNVTHNRRKQCINSTGCPSTFQFYNVPSCTAHSLTLTLTLTHNEVEGRRRCTRNRVQGKTYADGDAEERMDDGR